MGYKVGVKINNKGISGGGIGSLSKSQSITQPVPKIVQTRREISPSGTNVQTISATLNSVTFSK